MSLCMAAHRHCRGLTVLNDPGLQMLPGSVQPWSSTPHFMTSVSYVWGVLAIIVGKSFSALSKSFTTKLSGSYPLTHQITTILIWNSILQISDPGSQSNHHQTFFRLSHFIFVKDKVRQAFRRIKAKGGSQRPREDEGTLREEG